MYFSVSCAVNWMEKGNGRINLFNKPARMKNQVVLRKQISKHKLFTEEANMRQNCVAVLFVDVVSSLTLQRRF